MSVTYDGVTYPGASPSSLIALSTVLPALGIFTTVLRFNIRRSQRSHLQMDDWVALVALVLIIAMGATAVLGVQYQVWGHITPSWRDPNQHSKDAFEAKLLLAFQYIQIAALTLNKLSVLLLYRRIFDMRNHRYVFNIIITVTMVVLALWFAAMIIMNSLECGTHFAAFWDPQSHCAYIEKYDLASAISNVILDIWILVLPLPQIAKLHVNRSRKLACMAVFMLGLTGVAGSIIRLVYFVIIIYNVGGAAVHRDYRLEDTQQVYWSNLEIGLCFLAVNLPSLKAYSANIRSGISTKLRAMQSYRNMEPSAESAGLNHTHTEDQHVSIELYSLGSYSHAYSSP